MVTFRRSGILLFFLSFVLYITDGYAANQIRFSWAMLVDTSDGLHALDFSTPPLLHEGSTLQLYFHPDSDTYIYVFLHDSSNEFFPVFPGIKNYYDSYSPGDSVYIPAGEDRFTTLPPAGQEKFYLIASPTRLLTVENLIETCLDDPEDRNSSAALFHEIRSLRRTHSKISQFTEKGMPVSGTLKGLKTRGAPGSDTFTATEVIADGFYSRILRLNHE